MADQQAAVFGECCFDVGDVKITMGTGTFMDINTGSNPHTSVAGRAGVPVRVPVRVRVRMLTLLTAGSSAGLYPLVGWKIGSEVVYLAEGNAADTGTAIKWAQDLGELEVSAGVSAGVRTRLLRSALTDCLHLPIPDLFSEVQQTSAMAYSVRDSGGVCFVPSFSGLQV